MRSCAPRLRPWRPTTVLAIAAAFACASPAGGTLPAPPIATFSIVAWDSTTGDLGVAVQSKFFAVGSVVPWARAGAGAIATQAFGNTTYGPRGLEMLAAGRSAADVLGTLLSADSLSRLRQVGIVDARGRTANHTGSECQAWAGAKAGRHYTCQGNILAAPEVVDAMARAFESTAGWLGDRLLAALDAGQAAGGDARGMQSAALVVVRAGGGYGGYDDRWCDLRVDDAANPLVELRRLYRLWKPNALVHEGYTACDRGRFERALELGRAAVELDPNSGGPHYHLACYFARAGRADEALESLAQAVKRDPKLAANARTDPDFKPLAADPRFAKLTGSASADR